jgi:hypothetical protein
VGCVGCTGSLGIIFGNFGRHGSILIKDITPGYPASHNTRLVPGLKCESTQASVLLESCSSRLEWLGSHFCTDYGEDRLKKVDGRPIAGLMFAEALQLVKSASRPVTLSVFAENVRQCNRTKCGSCVAPGVSNAHRNA